MKKTLLSIIMVMGLLVAGALPAGAAGGTITVDPYGLGTNWQHEPYGNGHYVALYFDYPAGDPTPLGVKLNWNQSVGGKYMCLVPSGSACYGGSSGTIGKYTTDYSETNVAVSPSMSGYWQFNSDGPYGGGRRLVLVFFPGSVHPTHGQNVALRANIKDHTGTWVGWNATVVYVTT